MEVKEIKELANRIMFDVNDDEANRIIEDFKTFEKQLEILSEIDTENVEEMIYPFDTATSYLRADVADHVIDVEDALKNAPKVKEGHIVVPKVVK